MVKGGGGEINLSILVEVYLHRYLIQHNRLLYHSIHYLQLTDFSFWCFVVTKATILFLLLYWRQVVPLRQLPLV